mmetsp:Transcript_5240/g.3003  ORF Transcript_5240/g.3003 Transcript_5240/m.3003 type:complete len:442 (-) Transcript_5240:1218-2543(-)
MTSYSKKFLEALAVGRLPNTVNAFGVESKALIVSPVFISKAMEIKGNAMCIAVNARHTFAIKAALLAAQKKNSALIIELAKSEGGKKNYCPYPLEEMPGIVNQLMNELEITVPVGLHIDHYAIKSADDVSEAEEWLPKLFNCGYTSGAIDPSHLPSAENVLATLRLAPMFKERDIELETEVGEIKGKEGLSTPEEAAFQIKVLNAHGVHPLWIALNNGSTHGVEITNTGIQVDLTAMCHDEIAKYGVSGAQHGTSGNDFTRLKDITTKTKTTKANVATALQYIALGIEVDEFGNANFTMKDGEKHLPVKVNGAGVSEELWAEMTEQAIALELTGGNFKKIGTAPDKRGVPFFERWNQEPDSIQQRMIERTKGLVLQYIDVFGSAGTADIVIEQILKANHYTIDRNVPIIESKDHWTEAQIMATGNALDEKAGDQVKGLHDE